MKRIILAVSLIAVLVGARPVGAAAVTGANGVVLSMYANPFDPGNLGVVSGTQGTTLSAGPTSAGTAADDGHLANVVNRQDGSTLSAGISARVSGTATSDFVSFQQATPFRVGTVISDQYTASGFDNPMAFTVKLDGVTVQSGPGTVGTHPIQVTTLLAPITASQLRVDQNMVSFGGSATHYADFSEALVLPDQLNRIAATVTAVSGTSFGSSSGLYDLDGNNYWGGNNGATFTLNFGQPTRVNALVMIGLENTPSVFNILTNGVMIGQVTMPSTASNGSVVPIRFDTPVIISSLTFVAVGASGLDEVIAFDLIPEPSTIMLLGLGGLVLWRRLRKSAVTSHQ